MSRNCYGTYLHICTVACRASWSVVGHLLYVVCRRSLAICSVRVCVCVCVVCRVVCCRFLSICNRQAAISLVSAGRVASTTKDRSSIPHCKSTVSQNCYGTYIHICAVVCRAVVCRRSSSVVGRLLYVVCFMWPVVCRLSFVVGRLLSVVRVRVCVVCRVSFAVVCCRLSSVVWRRQPVMSLVSAGTVASTTKNRSSIPQEYLES